MTISGAYDLAVQKVKGGALVLQSSRNATSNITISSTEDLGGGLKAGAVFSQSPNTDTPTGASTTQEFGNNGMYVNLAGGFGDVKMGYWLDPVFSATQTANSTKGVTGFTARAGTVDTNGVYVSNQVLYTSPSFSGVSVQVSYAPSEVSGTKATTGLMVSYAAAPLAVNYAQSKIAAGNSLSVISASYDLGSAKLFGTATKRQNSKGSTNIGVSAPFGAVTVWGDYTNNKITDTKATQAGAKYALSKRTTVYAAFGTKKAAGVSSNGMNMGVAHAF